MQPLARAALALLLAALCLAGNPARAQQQTLKVAVLENSPPMSFRDPDGRLTGFTIEIARALCADIGAACDFQPTFLDRIVDALAAGEYDFAAVSLLDTPERRARILLGAPYYRSITLWFARPGVQPGEPGQRIAVVRGSAQEAYARKQGWETVGVRAHSDIPAPLAAGIAQGAILPMNTGIGLQKNPDFQRLGLTPTVMKASELLGNASFAINPRRPELKEALDAALERIKRNGIYDRINSQFLPFRVQ